jgi:hypothetical protein
VPLGRADDDAEVATDVSAFQLHGDVLSRRVGDELVLVHMGRNEIFSLNTTGARLWELWNGGCSRDEAVEQLRREYDASRETIEAESDRLLALLEAEGLGGFRNVGG